MQSTNKEASQSSTARHQSFLDEFTSNSTSIRDMEDSTVPESAMTDVRIEDTLRSEANTQHQHLVLTISTNPQSSGMDTGSPASSAEYETGMPSPTAPTFPHRLSSQGFPESLSASGSKRSSAYFTDSSTEDLCNDTKRRRRHPNIVNDSNPQPSSEAVRVAESLRRSGSQRPRIYRCRSHSLPDQTTLSKIVQGVLDLNQTGIQLHYNRVPSSESSSFSFNRKRHCRERPIPPPITRQSLRELETSEILKNAQLIHDIIHDPSLQFRPNLEGPRGEKKRQLAEQYWSALEREVDRLKVCLHKDPSGLVKLSSNRFPVLFVELRDILCSLLPSADRAIVEEVVDPDFLCQQLFRGCLDVENLARFLGKTMKEHCAPMRDSMVEKMMKQFQFAKSSGETSAFILGLRMIFELLEGMKLDVANHQLRTMKKDLQDRAVSNEREYFDDRIMKGKIDLTTVIDWLKPSFQASLPSQSFTAFSKAFVNLLSPLSSTQFPATFLFDIPRLNNFRKDFRDLISVQLCLLLYRELSISLHPQNIPPPDAAFNALRLEIWSLLSDLPEVTKYALASPSLAVQIALRATQHATPSAVVPPSHLVNIAQGWLDLNVAMTDGKLFMIAEKRVQEWMVQHLTTSQTVCIPQTMLRACECEGSVVWAVGTETAMWLLAERMHRVAAFHWLVFGDVYVGKVY